MAATCGNGYVFDKLPKKKKFGGHIPTLAHRCILGEIHVGPTINLNVKRIAVVHTNYCTVKLRTKKLDQAGN